MSHLLYEDEDWLLVQDYIHDDPDSFQDWEFDDNDDQRFEWYYESIYEANIIMQIDKYTGQHYLLQVTYGDIVLEPVGVA